ncbi:hypothetical protein RHGRI_028835 [Rhododendron griersonianum]|uniref:Uncharacterized protein n=1 Tax=Rhododendron griersonianum TaxID=479676 RepID=A0AAV6IKN8_9ERIC|nr:hypothetical protein RHGRI_028835 [Rhododendron griersonianum]
MAFRSHPSPPPDPYGPHPPPPPPPPNPYGPHPPPPPPDFFGPPPPPPPHHLRHDYYAPPPPPPPHVHHHGGPPARSRRLTRSLMVLQAHLHRRTSTPTDHHRLGIALPRPTNYAHVMRDPSRISRGSGFVAFSTSEETSRAGSLFVWAGFGYQQQLVPGMRPGAAPMPNFYMPLVHQGQQGQQPGGRRGGGPMMPRGRVYRYPPGRNMLDVSMPGVGGGMLSVPYDMGGMLPRNGGLGQPLAVPALATALANAPPYQQRTVWVAYKESSWLNAFILIVLLICFGSLVSVVADNNGVSGLLLLWFWTLTALVLLCYYCSGISSSIEI